MSSELEGKIESILFASGQEVELSRLIDFLKSDKKAIEEALENLKLRYNEKSSGLSVVVFDDWVKLTAKSVYADLIKSFLGKNEKSFGLSKALLEVLSIVAYRGPIDRISVDYIRAANSSFALRSLMEKGFISRVVSKEGRGYVYQVTPLFFESVGICEVGDLPDYDKLKDKR